MAATSPTAVCQFAARGSNGLWACALPDGARHDVIRDGANDCKVMAFSNDGSHFAWATGAGISVVRLADNQRLQEYPLPRTYSMIFSPKGNFLAAWEPYSTGRKGTSGGDDNLHVWNVSTGECVTSYIQKKHDAWQPLWTADEQLCARIVTGEAHFFNGGAPAGAPAQKLRVENVTMCSLSPSSGPYYVATHQGGIKGGPAFIRMYRYPGFENILASRSVYKCDSLKVIWNKQGTAFLGITSIEVDSTGTSYYGEQHIHYLDSTGTNCMVTLSKKGPVYSVSWHPSGKEFCVVYGLMPAKATLFNLKCEPVFDFGTGPRNEVSYNCHGTVICLSGFGNLPGHMEFWNREKLQIVSKSQATNSTYFDWAPDGEHFITATTAPRLRQDNGYRVWHYSGKQVAAWSSASPSDELWQVQWQPVAYGTFPCRPVIGLQASVTQEQKSKPAAYRPPGARGTTSTLKLHELERPRVVGAAAAAAVKPEDAKPLSKSAQKNKRRRDAKTKEEAASSAAAAAAPSMGGLSQAQRDAVAMATSLTAPVASSTIVAATSAENEKKIRGLRKKLQQVEKLKAQQAEGKKLEANQLEKLKGEAELLKQIEELSLAS